MYNNYYICILNYMYLYINTMYRQVENNNVYTEVWIQI